MSVKFTGISFQWFALIFDFEGVFEADREVIFLLSFGDGSRVLAPGSLCSGSSVRLDLSPFSKPIVSVDLDDCFFTMSDSVKKITSNMFPKNNKEYENSFIRKVQRSPSPSLQYFVAIQIWLYFTGSPAYRCGSAVVLCYKSVEIGDAFMLERAREICADAIPLAKACAFDWHPRRNGEHLTASLLCAQYHVALAEGDKEALVQSLDSSFELLDVITNFFTPSYPLSLSILLSILVDHKLKTDNSNKLIESLENVFKLAVRDSSINKITLFQELRVTHRSVVLAKMVISGKVEFKEAFLHSVRVAGQPAEILYDKFNNMFMGC